MSKHQFTITVHSEIEHFPGNEGHLRQMILSYLAPKGVPTKPYHEDGSLNPVWFEV